MTNPDTPVLVDQPSAAPTPKLVAGAVTGAVLIILTWVASLFGVNVPTEVAQAILLVGAVGAGYFKRNTVAAVRALHQR